MKSFTSFALALLALACPWLAFSAGQSSFTTARKYFDAVQVGAAGLGGAGTYWSKHIQISGKRKVCFFAVASGMGGTSPTLDIVMQGSPDSGTTFLASATFTQITADGIARKDATTELLPVTRCFLTVGGTTPVGVLTVWAFYVEPSIDGRVPA